MNQIFEQSYAGTENRVFVLDEPGNGNGCHAYQVQVSMLDTRDIDGETEYEIDINFQEGPAKEVGLNGVQNEHLLAMVAHRLQGFQSGPYSCRENALALTKIQEAMHWLEARTKDRSQRNVEGTNQR